MPRFAAVLLVDPAGRLLLQERDEHAPIDPERWGLPGGHVEPGEDDESAARRELAEETGLRLPAGELTRWEDVEVFHEFYDSLDTMTVWTAPTEVTDVDIVLGEGRRIVFVEPDAARALPLTASAAIAVPRFLDSPRYADLVASARSGR